MIEYTAPYFLVGQAGKTLDGTARTLEQLGIASATLRRASLDVSTLTFTIPKHQLSILPDQEQEIALMDSEARILFRGRVTRKYSMESRTYTFTGKDVWARLLNAPLLGTDAAARPYRVYPTQSVQITLASIIAAASGYSLPVQTQATWPTLYAVPKMALRSASIGDSILTVLKYVPDAGSDMDFSANPARLVIKRRGAPHVINTDVAGHGVKGATLEPQPWQKALGVTIHSVERTSYTDYTVVTQSAGNTAAEADRQISLLLSGYERTDASALESLNAALVAYREALAALNKTAADLDAAGQTAAFPMTWANILSLDSALQQARAVSSFDMSLVTGTSFSWHSQYYKSPNASDPYTPNMTVSTTPMKLRNAAGVEVRTGWYVIRTGAFTDAQLAQAGATKQTLYYEGELRFNVRGYDNVHAGMQQLQQAQGSKVRRFEGYTTAIVTAGTPGTLNRTEFTRFYFYMARVAVTAISKSPAEVAAILKAGIIGDIGELAEHTNFVNAPGDLAENYFQAQNWIPMTGNIVFNHDAPWKPAPGDCVQLTGADVDPEWSNAIAPISAVSIDLRTGQLTAEAGFPARKTLSSLMDALQVPPEDNWQ